MKNIIKSLFKREPIDLGDLAVGLLEFLATVTAITVFVVGFVLGKIIGR